MINEGVCCEEIRTCPLCGLEGLTFYSNLRDRSSHTPGVWNLLRCPACGLVWLNPRPVLEDIGKLYFNYTTHTLRNCTSGRARIKKMVNNSILSSAFGYQGLIESSNWILGRMLARIGLLKDIVGMSIMFLEQKEGKLLDVGCGNGQFLVQMRDLGWQVMGVEPDAKAAEIAQKHFGLNVFVGSLEAARFPENTVDVITMHHVIEHVPDPIRLLLECRHILA